MQGDRRVRLIMMTESHHVLIASADAQAVALQLEPGLVHWRTRHFTVQRVRILGRRAAVCQQPGVKREAAVSGNHLFCRQRLAEHVLHCQIATVELRIPDHLPQPREDHQMPAGVLHA
ncbi:hypothetical protein D3C87_1744740 [compost metagenome]